MLASRANASPAAIVGIAAFAWNMFSSLNKVAVPDPTVPMLLEIHNELKAVHERLSVIELGVVLILKKVDYLISILDQSIEEGEAKTDAIHLTAECVTFSEQVIQDLKSRLQYQEYLKSISVARNALMQRSDVHGMSICAAAYTEIGGHLMVKSNSSSMHAIIDTYLNHFARMDDKSRTGSLVNLETEYKERLDDSWSKLFKILFPAKPNHAVPPELLPSNKDAVFELVNGRQFGIAWAIERTYAQYDTDLTRLTTGPRCGFVMFRETPTTAKEPLLRSMIGAKPSTAYSEGGSCGFAIKEVNHAIHDRLYNANVTSEEVFDKYADIDLREILLFDNPVFDDETVYNGSKAFVQKLKNPKGADYDLAYGRLPGSKEFPLAPGQVSRAAQGDFVFHTGALDRGQPHNVADEKKRRTDHLNARKNLVTAYVSSINAAQEALAATHYIRYARADTEKFLKGLKERL